MYNVHYPPPRGGGILSSLLGKNIKFRRGEGNILAVGKNITLKKELRSNFSFSIISGLLGRTSNGKKGKGVGISGKKIKILKNGGGEK